MNGFTVSNRVIAVLATVGVISLLTGFVAAIFGEPAPTVRSAGADAFSRSALGHRAFVELLRRTDRRVVVSRRGSAQRAVSDGILVLIEPIGDEAELPEMLATADRVFVVLPKREGRESDARPGWLEDSALLPVAEVVSVLSAFGIDGAVERPDRAFEPDQPADLVGPTLSRPQLVASEDLEPIIAGPDGILLGRAESSWDSEIWVLSDPDLIENHGIGDAPNAALVIAIVDRMSEPGDVLVVDETLHGHEIPPHVFGALGRFPLVLALIQGAIVLAAGLWCASRRLGAPLPPARALEPGRLTLVSSTAELLLHGGHSGSILVRYFNQETRRVARARNLPRGLDADARRVALRDLEHRRPPEVGIDAIADAVDDADDGRPGAAMKVIRAARMVHRWRTEMLHGTE